ncbi:MAG: glycosyltransferase family 39 protein [Anaerolineae bacterium]|nr:glycosyltransferase family 39 protein [Anaerolineae bacterium]
MTKRLRAVPDLFLMSAIVWIAFLLRIIQLDLPSLWLDEAVTWAFVSAPLDEAMGMILDDFVHPPLHYLLLRPVAAVTQSEFALRLPSVILGVVSIALIYRLGREVAGDSARARLVGLLAAALLAVNPFHAWYAREARNYELAFLLSLLAMYLFHRILRGEKKWAAFILVSALAYLTHYFTLLLAWTQLIYYLVRFREHHRSFYRWLLAQIVAGIPIALWVGAVISRDSAGAGIGWIPAASPAAPLFTLWNLAILYVETEWLWWGVAALPLFAAALILGLRLRPRRVFLALWLFLPGASTLLASWVTGHSLYVDRYLIISLPAFVLLLARGLSRVRRSQVVYTLSAVLLVVSTVATIRVHTEPKLSKQDWREAMRIINERWEPGDLRVVGGLPEVIPAAYYQSDPGERHPPPPYPEGNFLLAVINRSGLEPWTFLHPRPDEDPWLSIVDQHAPSRIWLICAYTIHSNHRISSGNVFDAVDQSGSVTNTCTGAFQGQVLEQYVLTGLNVLLIDPASGAE